MTIVQYTQRGADLDVVLDDAEYLPITTVSDIALYLESKGYILDREKPSEGTLPANALGTLGCVAITSPEHGKRVLTFRVRNVPETDFAKAIGRG